MLPRTSSYLQVKRSSDVIVVPYHVRSQTHVYLLYVIENYHTSKVELIVGPCGRGWEERGKRMKTN